MKTVKKIKSIIAILIISLFLSAPIASAQMLAPNDPGGEPGTGDDPIGGGAPIGSGTLILIGFALAYVGKKVYEMKRVK